MTFAFSSLEEYMSKLDLDGKWREWKGSEEGRAAFMEKLGLVLYQNPGRFGFEDADEAAEALLSHRVRIASLLDRYVEQGSSFEGYVATSLRFLARSARRNKKRAKERDMACERSLRFSAEAEGEWEDKETEILSARQQSAVPEASSRRHRRARASRILFLFVKCAWEAGDRETRIAAELTGLPEALLATTLAQARRFLEVERCRFERLVARRDRSWTALRIHEARLAEEAAGPRREEILAALARARKEHEAALSEIRIFKPLVPNSVVAKLLRVPKGSVDSGIHYLKRSGSQPCPAEPAQASLRPWNSSSPRETRISSSNSAPSSPDTGCSGRPMSAIQPLMSKRTV